jgi:hypothetical protein
LDLRAAYHQRGIGLMNQRYYEAEAHIKEGIRICESPPNLWKGMISFVVGNLGLSYWLQGDFENAYETLMQGLREREKLIEQALKVWDADREIY